MQAHSAQCTLSKERLLERDAHVGEGMLSVPAIGRELDADLLIEHARAQAAPAICLCVRAAEPQAQMDEPCGFRNAVVIALRQPVSNCISNAFCRAAKRARHALR